MKGRIPDLDNVTSRSICRCVCGTMFTIKSAANHYSNVCSLENSTEEILEFKANMYNRTKEHRKTKKSKVMTQKHNRHYRWLTKNEEPDMEPEKVNNEPSYENCWFDFRNKSNNLLHYKKACLEKSTDILLSFRLLADWLVDRSSGRVRLLKDKNINQRADLWKYKDLTKLLVMFHPDSAQRRLTYKMSDNIILCFNKVLTWFFSILNNKKGYLERGWEPIDEKKEDDKGFMNNNQNRTINEESDLWDTNTREGIQDYSDIKNKKWNDWNKKFIIFRENSLLKFETDMNNADKETNEKIPIEDDIVIPKQVDLVRTNGFMDDNITNFSINTHDMNTYLRNSDQQFPTGKELFPKAL